MTELHPWLGDLRHVLPMPWAEMCLVLAAIVCGAVVGVERERRDKPAGLRTMMLICVGSAIFTMASRSSAFGNGDSGRIAAQIVTGVGFLGVGAIWRDRGRVSGLTTAATIWATAAVGLVAGAGFAFAALALSIMILLTLTVVVDVEGRLAGPCEHEHVRLTYRGANGKARVRMQALIDQHRSARLEQDEALGEDLHVVSLSYCRVHPEHRAALSALADMPAVEAITRA